MAVVEAVCILTRSDKRKDRVEISPLQLHLAVVEAEVSRIVRETILGMAELNTFHLRLESRKGVGQEDLRCRMGKFEQPSLQL